MRADKDVHLALLDSFQRLFDLLRGAEPVDIGDVARHVGQTLAEGVVVLHGEHGGGHQHGHLLAVAHGLERRSDGDFGLAEAHVAANETVHRVVALHIGLHLGQGLDLVGGVFVDERRFQRALQVAVGRVGEPLLGFAFGVELDQIDS